MARTPRVILDRDRPGAPDAAAPHSVRPREAEALRDRPTLDEIAEEAYAIYLGNGARDGYAMDDWLEAERRILTKRTRGD